MWLGDVEPVRRYVASQKDDPREQAGHVLQRRRCRTSPEAEGLPTAAWTKSESEQQCYLKDHHTMEPQGCCNEEMEEVGCDHALQLPPRTRGIELNPMNHRIGHVGMNQVRYQLEQQTTTMTPVQGQKIRDNTVVFEEDYSCFDNKRCEPDRVGGAKQQRSLAGSKVPGLESKQQIVVQHGQCRYASSGVSSRADWPCSKFEFRAAVD